MLIQQLNLPSTSDPCACLLLLLLYHQQEEMMSGRRRITVLFVALLTLISCVSHGTVFAQEEGSQQPLKPVGASVTVTGATEAGAGAVADRFVHIAYCSS